MMNNNNTSNFNNNPSDPSKTYVYCYMGLASGFLLLMLSITLFSHYCCTTRNPENRRQSRGRRGGSSSNNNSNRTVIVVETADNSVVTIDVCEEQREAILNGFPVLLYSQVKPNDHKADDSTSLICSICLADYKDSEWLRLVPDCGHYFHKECVDAWFRLNLSCPMCRNSPLTTPLARVTPLAITRHDDSVVETAAQSVTIRIQ